MPDIYILGLISICVILAACAAAASSAFFASACLKSSISECFPLMHFPKYIY